MAKHGFDLADCGSSDKFKKILKENKIPIKTKKKCEKLRTGGEYCKFHWKGKDVEIITGNNPITGEYREKGVRPKDKGYASYIGIEGKPEAVKKLVSSIKKKCSFKDESKGRRDFI